MATSGSKTVDIFPAWLHLKFSWTEQSQSIEANTTTINWKLELMTGPGAIYKNSRTWKVVIDDKEYSGTVRVSINNNSTQTLASGTAIVRHDDEGKKTLQYSFSQQFDLTLDNGQWLGTYSGSGSDALDTIPRASSLGAANGVLDVEQTLTINRASTNFKHRLTYRCGDVAEYIAGGADSYTTATSIKWTPRIGLAAENINGTSVTVTLTLYTYTSDGTHVGTTTETITCAIPTSVKPSVTIAWEDVSGAVGTYGKPVQAVSKLKITLTEKTSHDSPIARRTITVNGAEYYDKTATTEVLKEAGSQKIAATIKDQRGRTGSNSAALDVLAYTAPVVSKLSVNRCNEDGSENDRGEYVKATFSAAVTNLSGKNKPTYKLRYKLSTASSYTEETLSGLSSTYTVTNYEYIFAADGNGSYDVEVVASDNHGTATRSTSASTAFTLLNFHQNGTSVGVGKVAENDNALEVALDADFQGPVFGRAYGLGALPAVPENADINTYTGPGIWAVRSTATAETIKNLPTKKAGRFIVAAALGQEDNNSKWRYIEQRFIPFDRGNGKSGEWIRYISTAGTDTWTFSSWHSVALAAYPIGSIHLRYDHTDPADLFGGTWTRITSYLLRGATANDTIGSTGALADGSGRTYVNISIWRRTA